MKTRIVIEIDSQDFADFSDPDAGKISDEVEQALHAAIYKIIEEYLHSDQFQTDLFAVEEIDYFPMDDCGTLCDYGNININMRKEEA